jgi:hypothetical protein
MWKCLAVEVGTSKITGGRGHGSHNKPIGCGASGAYASGSDEEEEEPSPFVARVKNSDTTTEN